MGILEWVYGLARLAHVFILLPENGVACYFRRILE